MAKCVISAKMPSLVDPTRTPLAYGDRALPRLNQELNDESLLLRQRALRSLSDHLHDPEHIVGAIDAGIVESVKELLDDPNSTVRRLATECLYIMATHACGREALILHEVIAPLARLFDDEVDAVRRNAHIAMRNLSENRDGAEAQAELLLIATLVKKLPTEHDEIKILILDTLHYLLRIDTSVALHMTTMEIFTDLLQHDSEVIRAKSARDIMDLSVPLEGKEKAVECDAIKYLVNLLKDPSSDVRANAAGALMFIVITTKGKYTAIHGGALTPLVEMVDDRTSEVRLNAIKVIGELSEAPEGRLELLQHVEKIRSHESDHIPAVVRAAKRTVEIITWLPGNPYYSSAY